MYYKGAPYEGSYTGLRARWNQTTNTGTLRIIMVHGMSGFGTITPGYGSNFAVHVAKRFDLTSRECVTSNLISSTGVTNFLRKYTFGNPFDHKLVIYELTWSPMTTQIKSHQFARDDEMKRHRLWGNNQIKSLVDSGFGDAMLYLNPTYRTKLQEPIVQTITKVEQESPNENDRIVFVTHSLGSKMTLDTIVDHTNNPAVTNLIGKTTDIIMLANQAPLLNLATETNELAFAPGEAVTEHPNSLYRALKVVGEHKKGRPRTGFETNTLPVVRVVAASDPNDDLTFPLDTKPVQVSGITVFTSNIYTFNAWSLLWLVEWPASAHTGYFVNDQLIAKLIEGFPKKGGAR